MHNTNAVIIMVCIGPGLVSRGQIGVVRVEQVVHPLGAAYRTGLNWIICRLCKTLGVFEYSWNWQGWICINTRQPPDSQQGESDETTSGSTLKLFLFVFLFYLKQTRQPEMSQQLSAQNHSKLAEA